MPFVKYDDQASTALPAEPDVRITRTGIAISSQALADHGVAASTVHLYWNEVTAEVGMTPCDTGDCADGFSLATRGRNRSARFLSAKRFFSHFGIPLEHCKAEGKLVRRGELTAFRLILPGHKNARQPLRGE